MASHVAGEDYSVADCQPSRLLWDSKFLSSGSLLDSCVLPGSYGFLTLAYFLTFAYFWTLAVFWTLSVFQGFNTVFSKKHMYIIAKFI